MNPESIRRRIAAQERDIARLESLYEKAEQEKRRAGTALAEAQRDYENAREDLKRLGTLPALPELRQQIGETERNLEALAAELAAIDARLREMAASVIREAKVVGATLFRLLILEELYRATFDTGIVDEASMVPLPNLWFAATRASNRTVVTGDFRQLPPIATAHDEKEYPLATKWLRTDIFTYAGVVAADHAKMDDRRLCALAEQYRMHDAIGELANVLVYKLDGNPLVHRAHPKDYGYATAAHPEPEKPLVLCTTSGANPWCARLEPGGFRYNIYSAIVSVRLAAQALTTGAKTVGLVTPYRAQTRLFQYLTEQLMEQQGLPRGTMEAATVHRFQGNEKDVVIFDLVDSPPFGIGKLLSGGWTSEAMRLLNVACTRAKGKLVVVAHHDYLSQKVHGSYSLATLLKHLEGHGTILDSRAVLQDYADPAVDTALSVVFPDHRSLGSLEGAALFNEGTFYPAFLEDLRSASEQVVIFSPFIAGRRLADVITALRLLTDRGVPVVVTRERNQSDAVTRDLIRQVSQAGVKVVYRKQLHEKLAFVDRRIG